MKTLMLVSSTRADYGLLYPVIQEFRSREAESMLSLRLAVTGTHLSRAYGETIEEIKRDGVRIDDIVPTPVASGSEEEIAENFSGTMKAFTDLFAGRQPDAVMVLGDRYEILAVCVAALVCRIPIFHLAGGDVSEGAVDDAIRHAITKMAAAHFPTNEGARRRIIQMGEHPSRVYNAGSTSIDNILQEKLLDKEEILKELGLSEEYILCTYHPVTLGEGQAKEEIRILVSVLSRMGVAAVFTKSNADLGGECINECLDEAAKQNENIYVHSSLGRKRYLSAMKYARCVVGNSSSGIIESPSLHVPTVNIGDRQKGRLRAGYVIDTPMEEGHLENAIRMALSDKGQQFAHAAVNPYGDGHAAQRIARYSSQLLEEGITAVKRFYEIPFGAELPTERAK